MPHGSGDYSEFLRRKGQSGEQIGFEKTLKNRDDRGTMVALRGLIDDGLKSCLQHASALIPTQTLEGVHAMTASQSTTVVPLQQVSACVYQATNRLNGKRYIGKTSHSLTVRQKEHCKQARLGSSHYFHKAIRKYGKDAFDWEVLEYADTEEKVSALEKHFIKVNNSKVPHGYNLTDGGEGLLGTAHRRRRAPRSAPR